MNPPRQPKSFGHLFSAWTWTMAWRDSRTSRKRLLLFSCSIILGIAALAAAGNIDAPLALRNPFAFAPAIAPHLAAIEAGIAIDIERIREAYDGLAARADRIVVEGAGGVCVPLDATRDMLDVARALSLPVVLVVGVRLGCLNHALLSAVAIRARGLALAGWVGNRVDPGMPRVEANMSTLDERLSAPRIATLGWEQTDNPAWGPGAASLGID